MNNLLTEFQQQQVLILFPGAVITSATYFQDEYLPSPIRVELQLPNQAQMTIVLRQVRHQDASLAREAELLPILRAAGLPVPEVLARPIVDPAQSSLGAFAIYSYLSGTTCQTLAEASTAGSQTAMELVVAATTTLADLTDRIRTAVRSDLIPEISLLDELEAFCNEENPWLHHPLAAQTISILYSELSKIESPLIFSNGDYQPANVLTDGQKLTGLVDFEYARYTDFLYGFVKYPIYDLRPLNKAGIIAYLLEQTGASPADFALRLMLGCLKTLRREIPPDESHSPYAEHLLRLLASALEMTGYKAKR